MGYPHVNAATELNPMCLPKIQHLRGRNLIPCLLAILCLWLTNPAARATLRVWSGGGGDNFWNTAANWTNGAPPVSADDLLFPPAAARLSNSNNLTAGTTFGSITFSGSNYV